MHTRLLFAIAAYALISSSGLAEEVTGAGASFPAPLYGKWADTYQKATGHKVNYQSIGSSGGVNQIKARTVDFGASDTPVAPEELNKAGLIQFPTVMGGVVPVVNVPGITPGSLKLNGHTLARLFLGDIKYWDDPAIKNLNPNVSLPHIKVTVVHRADGSGTTGIFSHYLSTVSPLWQEKMGHGNTLNWPTGTGGKGNDGVSAFVARLKGAIGYVEYAYAKQNKMAHVALINKAGHAIQPSAASFKAAALGVDWNKGSAQSLVDSKEAKAWPIVSSTYILLPIKPSNPIKGQVALKFFDWAIKQGHPQAMALDYVPLPESMHASIYKAWGQVQDAQGKALYMGKP
jgi:phosphate transport system substrate-binding protein